MKRIEGKSLLDILRNEKRHIRTALYLKVMEEVARFHSLGYWFGDAQLAHIFVDDSGVSGFIDMDSIRKNRLFRLKNLAKDLAGIFHPELLRLITDEEKMAMINCYLGKIDIKKKEKFLRLFEYYSARRWKK
jgi:aminoglycoside phosphotransferase